MGTTASNAAEEFRTRFGLTSAEENLDRVKLERATGEFERYPGKTEPAADLLCKEWIGKGYRWNAIQQKEYANFDYNSAKFYARLNRMSNSDPKKIEYVVSLDVNAPRGATFKKDLGKITLTLECMRRNTTLVGFEQCTKHFAGWEKRYPPMEPLDDRESDVEF